jgi:hypothetical protein
VWSALLKPRSGAPRCLGVARKLENLHGLCRRLDWAIQDFRNPDAERVIADEADRLKTATIEQLGTERLQQIAIMYAAHNGELHRLVARRGSADHATVEDACAFAWTRLLSADQVDLRPPRWHALG